MFTARYFIADLIVRGVTKTEPPPSALAHGLPDDDVWVAAVDAVYRDNNKKPLTALLRSDHELLPLARGYLADLIARGIKRPTHRTPTPAYDMSDAEETLLFACDRVRYYVHKAPVRLTVEEAVTKVAAQLKIDPRTLANAYPGKRGATRRKNKQRNPRS